MFLSFFQLSLGIRNVWPQRMSLKAFILLYILLLLAGMPVTLLACIPYGLFGILVAVCIYGLVICRDTASQNVCMGMIGSVLTVVVDNLLTLLIDMFISPDRIQSDVFSLGLMLVRLLMFYFITLFCGKILKKILLSGKGGYAFSKPGI